MIRYFRLRSGWLTWSQGGKADQKRYLRGRLLQVASSPDGSGDAWRLVLHIQCAEYEARISARMDEPEIASLIYAIDRSCAGDDLTISGSGRMSIGGESPTPLVEPLDLSEQDWVSVMELADEVAFAWQRRKRHLMSQSRAFEPTGGTA